MSDLPSFIKDHSEAINSRDWNEVDKYIEDLDYDDRVKFIKVLLKNGIDLENHFKLEFKSGMVTIHMTFKEMSDLYDSELAPYKRDMIDFDSFIMCLTDPYQIVLNWGHLDEIHEAVAPAYNVKNEELLEECKKLNIDSADLSDAELAGLSEGIMSGTSKEIFRKAKEALDNIFEGAHVEIEDDTNFTVSYPVDALLAEYEEAIAELDLDVDYGYPYLSEALRYIISHYYDFVEPYGGFEEFDDAAYQNTLTEGLEEILRNTNKGEQDETV